MQINVVIIPDGKEAVAREFDSYQAAVDFLSIDKKFEKYIPQEYTGPEELSPSNPPRSLWGKLKELYYKELYYKLKSYGR